MTTPELIDGIFGGAMYAPDERDFMAGAIAGYKLRPVAELPDVVKFDRNGVTLTSQGNTMSCTAQAAANVLEMTWFNMTGERIHVPVLEQIDIAPGMWQYQLEVAPRTGSEKGGDFTRSGFDALVARSKAEDGVTVVNMGVTKEFSKIPVTAYAKIARDPDVFRQWIEAGHAIGISGDVTRDKRGGLSNWMLAKQNGWLSFSDGWKVLGGHAVAIVTGYDFSGEQKYFIGAQSYGDSYGFFGDGTFRIAADEIHKLHDACFVIFPEEAHLSLEKLQAARAKAAAIEIMRKASGLRGEFIEEGRTIITLACDVVNKAKGILGEKERI